ncbi:tRNA pseudouridine(38-40) synthase TruA [Piscirickettsia litoralis]|uniref:tRNA pseudouridine synthase A n=1 Tax=Piscirickettsia litoralis TaxID=1891921 RepID=A0ABX3A143_9GAMM|nr:tRNA pseudouridine(38-40) synthase TruA [Piscirickettsia litoralis]ODN42195.1 tRNA pseudouridine(38-40) synthase TruA [Piscirickettsia litoralis]
MRIAVSLAYEGGAYCGWQIQSHSPSVQEQVEKALSRVANHPVQVVCAGRTDTGVHASHQIIHFDTDAVRPMHAWVKGANTYLPKDINLNWAVPVSDEFHARFSALSRRYRYIIYNGPMRLGLWHQQMTYCYQGLDEKKMQEAAQYWLGEHDFSSFRASGCQSNTPMRRIDAFTVQRQGSTVFFDVEANAFLHHMIRNFAGVLMEIGRGNKAVAWANEVLESRDRRVAGVTAPANGLYFVNVTYPDIFQLPKARVEPLVLMC